MPKRLLNFVIFREIAGSAWRLNLIEAKHQVDALHFPSGNQSGGRPRFRLHMLLRQAQEFDNRIAHAASDSNFDHAIFPARSHDTPPQTKKAAKKAALASAK